MNEDIVLQSNAPLHQSLRQQIGDNAYQWGWGSFFSEEIPFDSVSMPHTAEKIATLITHIADKHHDKETLHLYEFGAGLGILAANILSALKNNAPEVYAKTRLHISDNSKQCLNDIRQYNPLLQAHEKHLQYDTIDLSQVNIQAQEKPVFVYCTYLLDSLPANTIAIKDNKVYELLLDSIVRRDAKITIPAKVH